MEVVPSGFPKCLLRTGLGAEASTAVLAVLEGCALFQCLLPVLQMSPECNFSALWLIFFARGLSLALIVPIN